MSLGTRRLGGAQLRAWAQQEGWAESPANRDAVARLLGQWHPESAGAPVQAAAQAQVSGRRVTVFAATIALAGQSTARNVAGMWAQTSWRHPGMRLGPEPPRDAPGQVVPVPGVGLPLARLHGTTRLGAIPEALVPVLARLRAAWSDDRPWQVEWRERDIVALVDAPDGAATIAPALAACACALARL